MGTGQAPDADPNPDPAQNDADPAGSTTLNKSASWLLGFRHFFFL
jgi:hypothetical protein